MAHFKRRKRGRHNYRRYTRRWIDGYSEPYKKTQVEPNQQSEPSVQKKYNPPIFSRASWWLKKRNHNPYDHDRRFKYNSKILIIFVISAVITYIVLKNISSINENHIIFIPLGTALLVISFIVAIVYFIKILKEFANFFKRQRRWLKIILVILIIVLLLFAYFNREKIISPLKTSWDELKTSTIFDFPESSNEPNQGGGTINQIKEVLNLNPPDSSEIEDLVFERTNDERVSARLRKLSYNSDLSRLAREHSQDMLDRDFFDHVNPDGEDPTDRAKRMGIRTVTDFGSYYTVGIGENIHMMPLGNVLSCGSVYSEESVATCAMNGWMTSPGHRANILNNQYSEIGIGVACDTSECLLTQDFR